MPVEDSRLLCGEPRKPVETICGGAGEKAAKAVQSKGFDAKCGETFRLESKSLIGGKLL